MDVGVTWSTIPNFLAIIDCEISYICLMIPKCCELRTDFDNKYYMNYCWLMWWEAASSGKEIFMLRGILTLLVYWNHIDKDILVIVERGLYDQWW